MNFTVYFDTKSGRWDVASIGHDRLTDISWPTVADYIIDNTRKEADTKTKK